MPWKRYAGFARASLCSGVEIEIPITYGENTMTGQIVRAMILLIMAALTYLQGLPDGMAPNPIASGAPYVFGGMAPNPFVHEFCPPHACPPTPTSTPHPPRRPAPSSTPEVPPDPYPTIEPWQCPPIDGKKGWYISSCVQDCQAHDMKRCGKICGDCWEDK